LGSRSPAKVGWDVARTLGHGQYLDLAFIDLINDQVIVHQSEKHRFLSEVFASVSHARIVCEGFASIEKFGNPAICGFWIVPGNVTPNVVKFVERLIA
jgi:hypothetical protein